MEKRLEKTQAKAKGIGGKIFAFLFSRLTITVLVILLQAVYLFVMTYRFRDYATWVSYGMRAVSIIFLFFIMNGTQKTPYKMAWILLIAILPEMGTLLYILYGNKRPTRSLARKIGAVEERHYPEMKQKADLAQLKNGRTRKTAQYVVHHGYYPAWDHTKAKYYSVGDTMFEDLIEDLKRAEHYIFMEYFIVEEGELWDDIFSVLRDKASQGVDVRMIYDDVGSIGKLPKHFVNSLQEAGIQAMSFNNLKPFLSLVYNTRDHRKITVIDGYIGYTGGANLADEYANKIVRFGHWKDGGIRLYGEGVWNLNVMFLNMWNAFKETDLTYDKYRPHVHHEEAFETEGLIQPFSDTPLDQENLSENIYMEILAKAKSYVYIYTPYLILDSELENSLTTAAKRGVDVRIVTPGIPDKIGVFAVTRSNYRSLMAAGVKIYEYTPGFIHSKCVVSDNDVAVVGTINLDYRSLYLHFEDGVLVMENQEVIQALRQDCRRTFKQSHRVQSSDLKHHWFAGTFAFVLRLLSPLL